MGHFYLHTDFPEHPQVMKCTPSGLSFFVMCLAYCSHYKIKSFPKQALNVIAPPHYRVGRAVRDLLANGLLRLRDDNEYEFVDLGLHRFTSPAKPRTRHRREVKRKLLLAALSRRGELICAICNQAVDPGDCHVDHRHPVSKGGSSTLDNLDITHTRCNLRKGAKVEAR